MKPEDLKGKVVEILNGYFRVTKAQPFGEEWSLVGYWLEEGKEPEVPHIQHVVSPPEFIVIQE